MLELYRKLIQLRRQVPALSSSYERKIETSCQESNKLLVFRRWYEDSQIICLMNFSQQEVEHTA
ncbi:MAG: DUF3459 domain-containing protein, partial [Microcystaceae cyanobacterium]